MKRIFILTIIPAVLIGVGIGYAIGYFFYMPKLVDYAIRVDVLSVEVSNLMQTNSSLQQTVSSNEALITTQGTEITDLKSESTKQQTKITTQQEQITTQQEQIATQQEQIATLETERKELQTDLNNAEAKIEDLKDYLLSSGKRITLQKQELLDTEQQLLDTEQQLGAVLDIVVTQRYEWEYDRRTWVWGLPISIRTYREFAERPRPLPYSQWVDMATDPMDDYYIDHMVNLLTEAASEKRYNDIETLNYVISFVQGMPYTVDDETTPYDEYPRYPLETLFDRGGDCEDTSILVAALLDEMGYDVALLLLKNARHVAVGVSLPSGYGSYYEYAGKKYYYLESTGDGGGIGDFPPDFSDTTAAVYPL